MDRLELKVHPTFIVFAFVLIYMGRAVVFFNYIVALILHEFSHYYLSNKLGVGFNQMVFMPYGLSLSGGSFNNNKKEFYVAIIGPFVSIAIAIICVAIWWCFPVVYNYSRYFAMCNLFLGLSNLVPIYPLDGGRALIALMSDKSRRLMAVKIMKYLSLIFGCVFLCVFACTFLYHKNFTILTMSIFLLSAFFTTNVSDFGIFNIFEKASNVLPLKVYVINKSERLYDLIKYIRNDCYVYFYVIDNGRIVAKFSESDLLSKINRTT